MLFFEDSWNYTWKSSTTENGVKLSVSLPGYGKDDVEVSLTSLRYLHIKTKDGKFDKSFKVLVPIGSITAGMVNGILHIEVLEDKATESITTIEVS